MFNSHLFKVLVGFCGMIIIGLISLVIINSLKISDTNPKANADTPMPIKVSPPKTSATQASKTPVQYRQ